MISKLNCLTFQIFFQQDKEKGRKMIIHLQKTILWADLKELMKSPDPSFLAYHDP